MKKHILGFLLLGVMIAPASVQASVLDIQSVTSEKGITAWLVEDKTVPVLSLQFAFLGAGAINDPDGKQGVSQLLSNTLDEGAGDFDAKEFQEALNDNSISLSFSSSRDNFSGSLKTLNKYQDTAFELLSMALSSPRFEDEAIERMKQANMARIRSNMSDPEWLAARLSNTVLFENHAYARNSGGTLSSLPKITAQDLEEKRSKQFAKDNLIVAVSGNITAEDLKIYLDQVFANLPETADLKTLEQVPQPEGSQIVQHKLSVPQTVVEIAYPGLSRMDEDYFAAEVMNYIFGGAGFGSRLTETVREQNGLTYGIYSGMQDMKYADLYSIGTSTRSEKVAEVLNLIEKETRKIKSTKVTAKELQDAKSYLLGSVPLSLTSTDKIASVMLSFQSRNLPGDYLDIREHEIKKVTPDDIKRVANRILQNDKKTILLVGAAIEQDNQSEAIRYIETLPDIE